jgi:20S proteasome alpha/beta subunit
MTVCLACISKKHNIVAFGSDRMVTSSYPPIEFEHKIPKIIEINEYCLGMSSGNALISKELFDVVRTKIYGRQVLTKEIAFTATSVYQEMRLKAAEDLALKSRGLTHEFFVKEGAKLLPPVIYQMIDQFLATFNFNLELIIAGLDEHGPTIYGIRNPGVMDCYDSIGFHAIGNGGMHGVLSLVETYNPEGEIPETLYSIFRAKRIAEVAPGVGKETDIGMISKAEKIKYFDESAELYEKAAELFDQEAKARNDLIKKSKFGIIPEINSGKDCPGEQIKQGGGTTKVSKGA